MIKIYIAGLLLLLTACTSAVAQLPPPFPSPEPAAASAIQHTHGSVELGWYTFSEVYRYSADVNMSFDVGSLKNARLSFGGGILTLVKSGSEKHFDPERYRGTIEPAIYIPHDHSAYIFSIRHQSYHSIDIPRVDKESYELYTMAYQMAGSPNIRVELGKYMHRIDNDYDWEILGQVDNACLGMCRSGKVYGSAMVRYIKETGDVPGRSDFVDYSLETGIETASAVKYFAAYRQIHDINGFSGATERGLLAGVKFLW